MRVKERRKTVGEETTNFDEGITTVREEMNIQSNRE
jgi:hypothetical protein